MANVDRIELGVDRDDCAILRFFGARQPGYAPPLPMSELRLSTDGIHTATLGVSWPQVELRRDAEGLAIHPGGLRIKVVGVGGSRVVGVADSIPISWFGSVTSVAMTRRIDAARVPSKTKALGVRAGKLLG